MIYTLSLTATLVTLHGHLVTLVCTIITEFLIGQRQYNNHKMSPGRRQHICICVVYLFSQEKKLMIYSIYSIWRIYSNWKNNFRGQTTLQMLFGS